jgi:hypothetical protein
MNFASAISWQVPNFAAALIFCTWHSCAGVNPASAKRALPSATAIAIPNVHRPRAVMANPSPGVGSL